MDRKDTDSERKDPAPKTQAKQSSETSSKAEPEKTITDYASL